jgi:hypothetical protein
MCVLFRRFRHRVRASQGGAVLALLFFAAKFSFAQNSGPRGSGSGASLHERVGALVKGPERCERSLSEILNLIVAANRIAEALPAALIQVERAAASMDDGSQRQALELRGEVEQKIAQISTDGSGFAAAEYRELHERLLGLRTQLEHVGQARSAALGKARALRSLIQECIRILPVVSRISGNDDAAGFIRDILKSRAAEWGGISQPAVARPVRQPNEANAPGSSNVPKASSPSGTNNLITKLTEGITVEDLSPAQAASRGLPQGVTGARIARVSPLSIGARSGIREGDILTEFGDQKIRSASDAVRISQMYRERDFVMAAAYSREGAGRPWLKRFFILENRQSRENAVQAAPVPVKEASNPSTVVLTSSSHAEAPPKPSFSFFGALLICLCSLFIGGAGSFFVSLLAAGAALFFFPWLTVSFTAKFLAVVLAIALPISRS